MRFILRFLSGVFFRQPTTKPEPLTNRQYAIQMARFVLIYVAWGGLLFLLSRNFETELKQIDPNLRIVLILFLLIVVPAPLTRRFRQEVERRRDEKVTE